MHRKKWIAIFITLSCLSKGRTVRIDGIHPECNKKLAQFLISMPPRIAVALIKRVVSI